VLLYRIWPPVIDVMVLVKPATVIEWHRKGFRFYWLSVAASVVSMTMLLVTVPFR
jgi:hypothetical protein